MAFLWALFLLIQCTTQSPIPEGINHTGQTKSMMVELSVSPASSANHPEELRQHRKRHLVGATASLPERENCVICLSPLLPEELKVRPLIREGNEGRNTRVNHKLKGKKKVPQSHIQKDTEPEKLYVWRGCGHTFHMRCIQPVLSSSHNCPCCRVPVNGIRPDPTSDIHSRRPQRTARSAHFGSHPGEFEHFSVNPGDPVGRLSGTDGFEWQEHEHLLNNHRQYTSAPVPQTYYNASPMPWIQPQRVHSMHGNPPPDRWMIYERLPTFPPEPRHFGHTNLPNFASPSQCIHQAQLAQEFESHQVVPVNLHPRLGTVREPQGIERWLWVFDDPIIDFTE